MSGPNFPKSTPLPDDEMGPMTMNGPFDWQKCDSMNVTIIQQATTGLYSGQGEKVGNGETWEATLTAMPGSKKLVEGPALAHAEAVVDGDDGPEVLIWFSAIQLTAPAPGP
jgi:hypothetical protein